MASLAHGNGVPVTRARTSSVSYTHLGGSRLRDEPRCSDFPQITCWRQGVFQIYLPSDQVTSQLKGSVGLIFSYLFETDKGVKEIIIPGAALDGN